MVCTGNTSPSLKIMMLIVLLWNDNSFLTISQGASFDLFDICSRSSYITESQGSVTSPHYPYVYPKNAICKIFFGGRTIKLVILKLHIQWGEHCSKDWLKIFHGAILFKTYCGSSSQLPIELEFDSGNVTLEFQSDSSVEFMGFKINYLVTDSTVFELCKSPSTVPETNRNNGIITTPNYPQNYLNLNYSLCSVTVSFSDEVFEILLRDFKLDTHNCQDAKCDWLKVYQDGMNITDKISGNGPSSPILVYPRVNVRVEFSSSIIENNRGFILEYHGLNKFYEMCNPANQSVQLDGESVYIISQNHPLTYGKNKNCEMNIEAPMYYFIQIATVTFELETDFYPCSKCRCDWFTIEEVHTVTSSQNSGTTNKQCGSQKFNITSTSNQIKLKFHSDDGIEARGFSVIVKAMSPLTTTTAIVPTTTMLSEMPLTRTEKTVQPTTHTVEKLSTTLIAPVTDGFEMDGKGTGVPFPAIGGAIGGLVLVILAVFLLIFVLRRRSRKSLLEKSMDDKDLELSTSACLDAMHSQQDTGDTMPGHCGGTLNNSTFIRKTSKSLDIEELYAKPNKQKRENQVEQMTSQMTGNHDDDHAYSSIDDTRHDSITNNDGVQVDGDEIHSQNKTNENNEVGMIQHYLEELYAKPHKQKRENQVEQTTSKIYHVYEDIGNKQDCSIDNEGAYISGDKIHSQNKTSNDDELEMIENDLYSAGDKLSDSSDRMEMIDNDIYSG